MDPKYQRKQRGIHDGTEVKARISSTNSARQIGHSPETVWSEDEEKVCLGRTRMTYFLSPLLAMMVVEKEMEIVADGGEAATEPGAACDGD